MEPLIYVSYPLTLPTALTFFSRVAKLGVKFFLAEKVLFQSQKQLEDSLSICNSLGVRFYPNFVYRYSQPWSIAHQILRSTAFNLSINSGDIGLATNLPHWLDLIEYISCSCISSLDIQLVGSPYESKRGGGLIDFAGTASGSTINGATFNISCLQEFKPPVFTLTLSISQVRLMRQLLL